jgi:lysophospholipase L1-like esterase
MSSPRVRLVARASTAVLLTLSAVACSNPDPTAERRPPGPTVGLGPEFAGVESPGVASGAVGAPAAGAERIDTVVMIGDSITRAATPELYERFEQMGITNILIQAQNSKRMAVSTSDNPSGAAIATFLTAGESGSGGDSDRGLDEDRSNELWVVALGTNDIPAYTSPDQIAGAVNEVLARVPDGVPLVWVDTYYEDALLGAAEVNSIIADRLARRGNAVVAPWSLFAPTDGVLVGDGVHPTDAGNDVFAYVVADTVQAFLSL